MPQAIIRYPNRGTQIFEMENAATYKNFVEQWDRLKKRPKSLTIRGANGKTLFIGSKVLKACVVEFIP